MRALHLSGTSSCVVPVYIKISQSNLDSTIISVCEKSTIAIREKQYGKQKTRTNRSIRLLFVRGFVNLLFLDLSDLDV